MQPTTPVTIEECSATPASAHQGDLRTRATNACPGLEPQAVHQPTERNPPHADEPPPREHRTEQTHHTPQVTAHWHSPLSFDGSHARDPPHILLLFSGHTDHASSLTAQLRKLGTNVTPVDVEIGGHAHDLTRPSVQRHFLRRIEAGEFHAVFASPPCKSFSASFGGTALRSSTEPAGRQPIPAEWEQYIMRHNALADFSAAALHAAHQRHIPCALEHPADRSDPDTPAHWKGVDHGSAWRMPSWESVFGQPACRKFLIAQCAFGADVQKYTTIATLGAMTAAMDNLVDELCAHGHSRHKTVAHGRDEAGRSRSAPTAAYPRPLAAALALGISTASLAAAIRSAVHQPNPEASDASGAEHEEGRMELGILLGPRARSAFERARFQPPRFASSHNQVPTPASELEREPFPHDVSRPMQPRPPPPSKALLRTPLPRHPSGHPDEEPSRRRAPCHQHCSGRCGGRYVSQDAAWALARARGAPAGDIAVHQLYNSSVYDQVISPWLQQAGTALHAIATGSKPQPVPTVVIPQSDQPAWARDIVWDCRDPTKCTPVAPSTRHTTFPGTRQVNRATLRTVASALQWHDHDIVGQIGEGGIEIRSECSLDTVLAFHHNTVTDHWQAVSDTVNSHIREDWVAPPMPHPPFVPMRLQPRGIVLQERNRLLPDGSLEEYLKPRVTTDNSFGGPDSVNAAVHTSDRAVELASVQHLARGWAICQTATDGADQPNGLRVEGYCVDAESAYSFCCVQWADLWLQAFVWLDDEGRPGFAVDHRLGFGGAVGPNRYQRVSNLVSAYAQSLQEQFDAANPYPAEVQRWRQKRQHLQSEGVLPEGAHQCEPRYIQAYIDDITGTATNDHVDPSDLALAHSFADAAAVSVGCSPSHPRSRVRVHASLAMAALCELGLSPAWAKILCGSPLPALGFTVSADDHAISCTQAKRDIITADIRRQKELLHEAQTVDRKRAQKLVGRLVNFTQIAPQIRPFLHGGFGLARVGHTHRATAYQPSLRLRRASPAWVAWEELLVVADQTFSEQVATTWAPRSPRVSRLAQGSITVVADASGHDGLGGYAFAAHCPATVFVLSEVWPTEVRDALSAAADPAQAALRRSRDPRALPHLPMPAGELFAALAIVLALRHATQVLHVFACGDCEPAVGALNARCSPNEIMQALLQTASTAAQTWTAVALPRGCNTDADRLTHPATDHPKGDVLQGAVASRAREHGLHVVPLICPPEGWQRLYQALATPIEHPLDQPRRDDARPLHQPPPAPHADPGIHAVLQTAHRLHLTGPLGSKPRDIWTSVDHGAGTALVAELRDKLHSAERTAWDIPRTRTALNHFADFLRDTNRLPFVQACGGDKESGTAYNRETLDLFQAYLRHAQCRSTQLLGPMKQDTIQGYAGAIYVLRCREAGYDIAPGYTRGSMACVNKAWRREDGPRGARRRSIGLRASHLRLWLQTSEWLKQQPAADQYRYRAMSLAAHNLLLRGGEVGVPSDKEADLQRVLRWRSLDWQHPSPVSQGRMWLSALVVPIKDTSALKKGYPCPIARRHDLPFGANAMCPYDAIARYYWDRAQRIMGTAKPFPLDVRGLPRQGWWLEVAESVRNADSVFFVTDHLRPVSTDDVRALARQIAKDVNVDVADVGAKAFRIGGATDWRAWNPAGSAVIVKERGRWDSDVGNIYQRPLTALHLEGSAAVGAVDSVDLEALCPGFAQPAFRA